jgi:hypothetical protein
VSYDGYMLLAQALRAKVAGVVATALWRNRAWPALVGAIRHGIAVHSWRWSIHRRLYGYAPFAASWPDNTHSLSRSRRVHALCAKACQEVAS